MYDTSGHETFHLQGNLTADNLTFTKNNNDLQIHIAAETITFMNHFTGNFDIETLSFDDGSTFDLDSTNIDFGTSGNDIFTGDANDNLFVDHGGNDTYTIGVGFDYISDTSGTADKILAGGAYLEADLDFYRTGGGKNLAIKPTGTTNAPVILDHFVGNGSTIETLEFYDGSTLDISTMNLDIHGTTGDDILYGYSNNEVGDDIIYGYAGNDTIYSHGGIDFVYAGDGNDFVNGESDGDTIYGEAGDDDLFGYGGTDVIYGGDGDDKVDGDDGNDILYGDAGSDTLYGDGGDDMLYGGADADTINGGLGADYIEGGSGNDKIYAGAGDNTIYGGDGNDRLEGGNDVDMMYGDGGSDYLYAFEGNDTLYGGEGRDYLYAYGGNDILYGGGDVDRLYASSGNDQLYGEDGVDFLYGQSGNNILNGGGGNDYLYGGTGADTFIFDDLSLHVGGSGYDRIYNFTLSQGDVLDMSGVLGDTTYNAGTDNLNDFLELYEYGNDMFIRVDADGIGTGQNVARLYGFNDWDSVTDVNTLVTNGTVVV